MSSSVIWIVASSAFLPSSKVSPLPLRMCSAAFESVAVSTAMPASLNFSSSRLSRTNLGICFSVLAISSCRCSIVQKGRRDDVQSAINLILVVLVFADIRFCVECLALRNVKSFAVQSGYLVGVLDILQKPDIQQRLYGRPNGTLVALEQVSKRHCIVLGLAVAEAIDQRRINTGLSKKGVLHALTT